MGKLSDKRLFLLDMDGTIYLDNILFEGTLDFLRRVKEIGGRFLFLTNNSSKSAQSYVEKLKNLGIESTARDFLTSTNATVDYVNANHFGKIFYAMGTESFISELKASGINVTTEPEDDVFGVIISNDTELSFKKLDDVSRLLTRGVGEYIATNPDWVCPTAFGYVPDCGSFAEMLERATGKTPRFIGKPRPEMVLSALNKCGYSAEEAVMIGDRLYTDIASGYNAGVDTVFVLSGEGRLADVEKSEIKPTYIMKDIKEVLEEI